MSFQWNVGILFIIVVVIKHRHMKLCDLITNLMWAASLGRVWILLTLENMAEPLSIRQQSLDVLKHLKLSYPSRIKERLSSWC